jgi:hypothetical protein
LELDSDVLYIGRESPLVAKYPTNLLLITKLYAKGNEKNVFCVLKSIPSFDIRTESFRYNNVYTNPSTIVIKLYA